MAARSLIAWADAALASPSLAEAARLVRTFAGQAVGPARFRTELDRDRYVPAVLPIADLPDGRVAVLHFHPDLIARSRLPVAVCGQGVWVDQAGDLRTFVAQMLALHRRDAPAGELPSLLRRFRWATSGDRPWDPAAIERAPSDEAALFAALDLQGPDHRLAEWLALADADPTRAAFVVRDLARAHPLHPARALASATRGDDTWTELLDAPAYMSGSAAAARTVRAAAAAVGARSPRSGARKALLDALDDGFLEQEWPAALPRAVDAAQRLDPGGPLPRCLALFGGAA